MLSRIDRVMLHLVDGPKSSREIAEGMGLQPIQARKCLNVLLANQIVHAGGQPNAKIYSLTTFGKSQAERLKDSVAEPIVTQALRRAPNSVWDYARALA